MADDELRALERRAAEGEPAAARSLLSARERAGLCPFHGEVEGACASCRELEEIDWESVFDEAWGEKAGGAAKAALAELAESLRRPFSAEEIAEIHKGGIAEGDPALWTLPTLPLPPSYLSFLAWSDGGNFTQGEREFGFFSTSEVRTNLLAYGLMEYLPGLVPIAMDGGGTFYLLDLRSPAQRDEYPILFGNSGTLDLDEDEQHVVAWSFLELCQGTTRPDDDGDPGAEYPELIDVWLARRPQAGLKALLAIKKALKIQTSVRELKQVFDTLPAPLLTSVPFLPFGVLSARFNAAGDDCLEVREAGGSRPVDPDLLWRA